MQPEIPPSILNACLHYLNLLEHWNRTHALTALSPGLRQEELILDACAFLPHLEHIPKYSIILDFGTGMGIPSLVIALARPDLEIFALDKSKKKIAFVRQASLELKLSNLRPVLGKAEDLSPSNAQVGVAKAVGEMALTCAWWTRHRINTGAPLLLAKGPDWQKEPPPENWEIQAHPYELPTRGARFILELKSRP